MAPFTLPNARDVDPEALISLPPSPTSDCVSTREEQDKFDSLTVPSTLTCELSFERLEIQPKITPLPLPVCKKKALLIGIQNYDNPAQNTATGNGQIKGPHADVEHVRQLLLDCYDYTPDDITVLMDDDHHVQPTEANLLRYMKDFVADARPGDEFYLHFSGHGTQVADENGDEEDGFDECILTCDNKIIQDDVLNALLVAPLPVGSTFVSSFDSCHSGTLLDLRHYRCNRVYVPWVNKGCRRTAFLRNIVTRHETQFSDELDDSETIQAAAVPVISVSEEPIELHPSIGTLNEGLNLAPLKVPHQVGRHPILSIIPPSTATHWVESTATPMKYSMVSPYPIFCTGRCREESNLDIWQPMADVISISSTKDVQLSWEDSHGSSMTVALTKVLRKNPHASLKHILVSISHELYAFYPELHHESRAYKDVINKINIRRERKGQGPCDSRTVEMNNFQNPQISSHRPLDMNRPWPLKTSTPCVAN